MKTKYVFTEAAEQIARDNNLKEYRKAGTAAHFAYLPLEQSPITARAWLDAGYIKEVPEPVSFLTFTLTTTASNAMQRLFKENNIKYQSGPYFDILYADIHKTGQLVAVDYINIGHDNETGLNLFEVIEKPMRTAEFFNIPAADLYKMDADGWTKEEKLLCDHHPDAHPFFETYTDAVDHCRWLKNQGYEDIKILQRINNKYAVIAY